MMISAGGTGGHIYPALALAGRLKKDGVECIFIGSKDRLEGKLIPQNGYPFLSLDIPNTSGSLIRKIKYVCSMGREILSCRKILRQYQPDAVIGFGNYISVPVILAAKLNGIVTMISEQNSFAGKANIFLGRYADAVELAYERSAVDFDPKKVRVLGNPQAETCARHSADRNILKEYGIDETKPFAAVMMGSLGSSSMSQLIDQACELTEGFQILIAAGKANDYEFRTKKPGVIVRDYISGIDVLKLCDLAVCRAGATTLAELAAAGTPSILVPSPFVPNNHQYYNALELKENGAAVLLEEKELTAESLAEAMNRLMKDDALRHSMSEHAAALAKPTAAEDMVSWLKEICDGQ